MAWRHTESGEVLEDEVVDLLLEAFKHSSFYSHLKSCSPGGLPGREGRSLRANHKTPHLKRPKVRKPHANAVSIV